MSFRLEAAGEQRVRRVRCRWPALPVVAQILAQTRSSCQCQCRDRDRGSGCPSPMLSSPAAVARVAQILTQPQDGGCPGPVTAPKFAAPGPHRRPTRARRRCRGKRRLAGTQQRRGGARA